MVREHNSLNPMFVGHHSILDTLYPFDHYGKVGDLTNPCQDVPVDNGRDRTGHSFGYPLPLIIAISSLVPRQHHVLE